jgi:hypothetical protein
MMALRYATGIGIGFLCLGGFASTALGAGYPAALFGAAGLAVLLIGFTRREAMIWAMIGLALLLLAGQAERSSAIKAFSTAAGFGALMASISFVALSARRSGLRPWLRRQLAGRRGIKGQMVNYAIAHAAGFFLNLTGLIILAAAMSRARSDEGIRPNLLTLQHGFALAPAWSPYSYFVPIVLTSFPGLSWSELCFVALLFLPPLLVTSLLTIKRQETIMSQETIMPDMHADQPSPAAERFALVCVACFCATFIMAMSLSIASPMVLVHWLLPPLALLWAVSEAWFGETIPAFIGDLRSHMVERIPAMRFEILALASAGLLSSALSGIDLNSLFAPLAGLPSGGIGNLVYALGLFIVASALMTLGVNPVLFVGFAASLVSAGLVSLTAGLAGLVGAWALFPTLSPFAAANLSIANEMRRGGPSLAFGLNARYNLVAFLCCAGVIAALALSE